MSSGDLPPREKQDSRLAQPSRLLMVDTLSEWRMRMNFTDVDKLYGSLLGAL